MQSPCQPLAHVACCIRHGSARNRVEAVLRARAVHVLRASWNDIASLSDIPAWHALVYDLNPWDDRALGLLRQLSAVAPATPILLYVPFIPGVEPLLEQCVDERRLLLKLQFADADECGRLSRELDRLRRAVPCEELLCLLKAGLPHVAARPWIFIEEGLRLVACNGGELHAGTKTVARTMGISVRTLERAFRETSLPHPKEVLNWLSLLYVTLWAQRSGWSPAAVARALDRPPNEVYRLRQRLLYRERGPRTLVPPDPRHFDAVLVAFFERCGTAPSAPVRAASGRRFG